MFYLTTINKQLCTLTISLYNLLPVFSVIQEAFIQGPCLNLGGEQQEKESKHLLSWCRVSTPPSLPPPQSPLSTPTHFHDGFNNQEAVMTHYHPPVSPINPQFPSRATSRPRYPRRKDGRRHG